MFRAGTIRFTKTFEYQDDLRGTNDFAGQVRLEGMVVGETGPSKSLIRE
jgi:hypothetical protein